MIQIESVECGLITPAKAKEYLKGVEYLVDAFAGLHARIATSNIYGKTMRMKDDDLLAISKSTFNLKKSNNEKDSFSY